MKIFALILIFLCLTASVARGFDWKHTNSVSVSWESVIAYEDGTPLPADAVIRYSLYTKEIKNGTELELPGLLAVPTGTITFTIEGRYYLGVKAVRLDADVIVEESTISWSDNPLICKDGVVFGVMYFRPHKAPEQLRSP